MEENVSFFDRTVCDRIIQKFLLRGWLFAILCLVIGFGYLIHGEPLLREEFFLVYMMIAFCILSFTFLLQQRNNIGTFGTTKFERKIISGWLQEEVKWWGKSLF
jgi:hypothetical protein